MLTHVLIVWFGSLHVSLSFPQAPKARPLV